MPEKESEGQNVGFLNCDVFTDRGHSLLKYIAFEDFPNKAPLRKKVSREKKCASSK